MEDLSVDIEGADIALTPEMIEATLCAVISSAFPFQALVMKKSCMRRSMKKPNSLSFRQFAVFLSRLNNALPRLSSKDEDSKFINAELIEILKFLLSFKCRSKLTLKAICICSMILPG